MNKAEFQKAYEIACGDQDLSDFDLDLLDGFGLPDFQPVTVPIETVARCIRWQCFYIGGGIDQDALNECRNAFRRKVTVVAKRGVLA
jgi:hypothetical protein